MGFNESLKGLFEKNFKEDVAETVVSADMRGKAIIIYGANNLGKTKQASRFKNPVFIPLEKGLNAINGALVLKTNSWGDLKRNVKKLSSKDFTDILKSGEQITLIMDGIEHIGTYAQNFLCAKYGVDDIGKANSGFGCWKEYEKMVWSLIDSLLGLGYTIVFIGHEAIDKKKDKYSIAGDERNIKPIRDNADICVYLQSNGIDEDGNVIPSSAYMAETDEYFARTKFEYMKTYLEEFSAENLERAIIEGIKEQNKAEGKQDATFEDSKGVYGGEETQSLDSLKEELYDMFSKHIEGKEDLEEAFYEIVEENLGETLISEATKKQVEALVSIKQCLKEILNI